MCLCNDIGTFVGMRCDAITFKSLAKEEKATFDMETRFDCA
jgi:hypothetical protein